jgi:GMP synthase-like glutamine amidotransferase
MVDFGLFREANHMLLVLQHSDSSTIGTLGPALVDHAHALRTIRLHRGEALPADLDDIDGIIALGGPQSGNDESPVLRREMDLMRTAHAMGLPLFGICLGCQLLAKALGGEVAKMAVGPQAGPEIGWCDVKLSAVGRGDPLFTGIGWTTSQFQWHHDEVVKLPPAARLLASSARCKVQAWGLGLRTYAVQFHPELDEAAIQRFVREGANELAAAGISANSIIEGNRAHLAEMRRSAERLFESWCLFVAPVERRYRGVAKDLLH